ncbi:zinc ABC transporter substrate-binding protein [Halobellus sp. Atlit-38R]|uniref:metal ABC transporter substrate-binding protein n=1 Tax=Halobellus sp. Atlit-38R TaxID=2282131 RepID=UPI000EF187FE|nr:metal ABC transporter substrate-binding protein [Halobellus sp. Atlit-38R]RLM83948.1 zinc ABC transporter substrate-binding protein [Halobellus sp. Atlit-38R]
MSRYTRRRLIAAGLGTATIGALAGCTSSNDDSGATESAGPEAQSSFFVFGDLASQVAGDTATAETLVPIGQHGHGWEPGSKIQGTILESDLFLYGMEGFQPWADDLVTSLRDDDADVDIVAAGAGINLIEGGHDHDHGHEEDHEGEHEEGHDGEGEHGHGESLSEHSISHACGHIEDDETEPLVAASSQDNASKFSQTHQPYAVKLTEETSYITFAPEGGNAEKYAFFTDSYDTVRPVETSVVHQAQGVESCDAITEYYVIESEVDAVTIELTGDAGTVVTLLAEGVSNDHSHGEEEGHGHEDEHGHDGEGEHEGEHDHESGEEHEDEHEGESEHKGEEGHNHDHSGGTDPHFWLDPERAKQAVDNIRSGFVDVDSDNASAYAENAESYRNRLDELDESFQSALESASKDVVFVAGHNAFQYLSQRYGFEVQTLTGLSPDDQPTPKDIERAQDIIAEHELQYVCADPLESQTAANQLVEETDATEVLPLTPIPGQTQEWADEDWGYVEIMENINLETLKQALDAE